MPVGFAQSVEEMSEPPETARNGGFDPEAAAEETAEGPVATPPALVYSADHPGKRRAGRNRRGPAAEQQLPLPLDLEPEPQRAEAVQPAEKVPPAEKPKRRGRRSPGFLPVTRDPDVARSYSDNVALDHAIAEGLARALSSLPPEELAALRAKVARAAREGSEGGTEGTEGTMGNSGELGGT